MTVWSWLKLTICLWLLRKAFKAAGWLLLAIARAALLAATDAAAAADRDAQRGPSTPGSKARRTP